MVTASPNPYRHAFLAVPPRVPWWLRLFAFLALRKGGTWRLDDDGNLRYWLPEPLPPETWFGPNPFATPSTQHAMMIEAWDHERDRQTRYRAPSTHHVMMIEAWDRMHERERQTRYRAELLRR